MNYVLNRAGSGAISEICAEDDCDAISQATELLGGDPVAADQWDADGSDDDGGPMERLLFWENSHYAANDPGQNSIAQLTVVRS